MKLQANIDSKVFLSITITLFLFLSGCRFDKGKLAPKMILTTIAHPTTNTGCGNLASVSFSAQVFPIITSNCYHGCHDAMGAGGIKLLSYSDVLGLANSGLLISAINGDPNTTQMPIPPYQSLDSCQVLQIYWWVQQGKLNN